MQLRIPRILFVIATVGALLVTVLWSLAQSRRAGAEVTETPAVSGGPSSVTQTMPSGGPSQYTSPLERCHTGPDYPISGANPILSEPLTTTFTSNLPLTVKVRYDGTEWYGTWELIFTNRSSQTQHVDCAVLIFRAPDNADQHHYSASQAFGHPQQDYLEVPRGDGTSFYIARLGFHDVPLAQRNVDPGHTFTYKLGGAPSGITGEQIRDSIRFQADLNVSSNTTLVKKYGTKRLAN